jgi:hypothetical protein
MFRSTETIEEECGVSQRKFTLNEIRSLQEALSSDLKNAKLRLREGEYQFTLAKAIGEMQLGLTFPDVKDIIRKMSGDKETEDMQVVRKIQTILKKMEKSNVVRILPKKRPWELQRYMLLSFKFQDAENNTVILAAEQQIKQSQETLQSAIKQLGPSLNARYMSVVRIVALAAALLASYGGVLWSLSQSAIISLVFIPALCTAAVAAVALGRVLGKMKGVKSVDA